MALVLTWKRRGGKGAPSVQGKQEEATLWLKMRRTPTGSPTLGPLPLGVTMVRVEEAMATRFIDEVKGACLLQRDGRSTRLRHYHHVTLTSGAHVTIAFAPDKDRTDAYAPGSKRKRYADLGPEAYERYGLSREGSRRSYGQGPPGAVEVRKAPKAIDPSSVARERMG